MLCLGPQDFGEKVFFSANLFAYLPIYSRLVTQIRIVPFVIFVILAIKLISHRVVNCAERNVICGGPSHEW